MFFVEVDGRHLLGRRVILPQRFPLGRCAHGHLLRDLLPAGIALGDVGNDGVCAEIDALRPEIRQDAKFSSQHVDASG